MWIEKIRSLIDDAQFAGIAESPAISKCEDSLGVKLPDDLKQVLNESNGVQGHYGSEIIWNVEKIAQTNQDFRNSPDFVELYMPFDHLLFFGDAGNGDQFAYAIQNHKIQKDDVFMWNHEDDSRTWIAPNLGRYFEWLIEEDEEEYDDD